MPGQKEITLVFEGSSVDSDFVANILEDCGVPIFIRNKNMGNLFPHYATYGGFKPVKIFVRNADFENARGIVATYFESR